MSILDEVRLLGDPGLRRVSAPVSGLHEPGFRSGVATLHRALAAFRERHGFGRAISAPQLGIPLRFIACRLGERAFTMVNPRITRRSRERFTLWDDCMSFPDLLVRVSRHASIDIEWTDESGARLTRTRLDRGLSELFQHELDHLDGVLAVDRALDRDSLVLRTVFEGDRERFQAMVDG
jgi:peptide deformylase